MGGLSVLAQINRLLPQESVLYFGDTAHVPYGGRPLDEVRGFALSICRFLVDHGVKMIVMACNVSSAVAMHDAHRLFPHIPIIGVIEPGSTAALQYGGDSIGVLATQGTVSSGAYTRFIHSRRPTAKVVEVACPKFVPLVEEERVDTPEAAAAAAEYLASLECDRSMPVILGCTHYPFLQPTLQKVAGNVLPAGCLIQFVDPAVETARVVERTLAERHVTASQTKVGETVFFVSGLPAQFEHSGSLFLGRAVTGARQQSL